MPKLSQMLLEEMGGVPDPRTKIGKKFAAKGVSLSSEFCRIRDLPRRDVDEIRYDLSEFYVHNPDKCDVEGCMICIKTPVVIQPKQNQSLHEAWEVEGLVSSAGVGSGKTLVTFLLHDVMEAVRTVLIVKPSLRYKIFKSELPMYRRHFKIPPVFHAPREMVKGRRLQPGIYVVTYHELSLASREGILDYIDPDLLLCDEVHLLQGRNARSKRFWRFLETRPMVRKGYLSGSLLKRTIRTVAPFSESALTKDSPYPRGRTLFEFSRALDQDVKNPLGAGRLMDLTTLVEGEDGQIRQETARDGFRRRVAETKGFISTLTSSAPEVSLEIRARKYKLSPPILDALNHLEEYWEFDNNEFGDALQMTRLRRQLVNGFFYRWRWKGGEPSEEDMAWLQARNAWNKEVRNYLKTHSTPGRDTPLQLFNAARRGEWASETFQEWLRWKDRPEPDVDTVWIDKEPLRADIRAWATEVEKTKNVIRGVLWFEHRAVQQLLIDDGYLTFGAGKKDATALDEEISKPTRRVIACSHLSHGTGVNMQRYERGYVINPMASGLAYQQLFGRMVRQGQQADEVIFDINQSIESLEDAVAQAMRDARFQQELGGEQQLLIIGDKVGFSEEITELKRGRHGQLG